MPDHVNDDTTPNHTDELIRRWRERLTADRSVPADAVDELEDHLRAEVLGFDPAGLTAQEKLGVAASRIGAPDALAEQFRGERPAAAWAHRLHWMVAGYLVVALLNLVVFTPLQNLQILGFQLGLGMSGPATVVLTCLGVSLTMAVGLAVAIPRCVDRLDRGTLMRRVGAVFARPAFLYTAVVLVPWIAIAIYRIGFFIPVATQADVQALGRFMLAKSVASAAIPFAAPLSLLIFASALRRHDRLAPHAA